MTTNATKIEPDNIFGKRHDDCSTKKLENVTNETMSGDIENDIKKENSSNKEMSTFQTENKKSSDLRNIETTDTAKSEELNFKGITDVVRLGDAYQSGIRNLKTEHLTSEANSDSIKSSVDKNIIYFTGMNLNAKPISTEEKIDAARGIKFTTNTGECREFSLEQFVEIATNETDYSDSNETDYSDFNTEKDSMSKTNCSLKFKEKSFCGEKAVLDFDYQNATDTIKIKNLKFGTSFDCDESIKDEVSMSDTKINRGLVQTSLGESIKQPGNSSSISAAKYVDSNVDKDGTYSEFNLVKRENASGKFSDSTLENSSTANSLKLGSFNSTIAVNDISIVGDKTFKKEIMATSSKEKTYPLCDPAGKNPFGLETLETNKKTSGDAKIVSNKDAISDSERINFGLKSNSSEEKSAIHSKNLAVCSTNELGNLSSELNFDDAKPDANKNNTSVSDFSFGIKPTFLEEKSTVDLENLAFSDRVENKESFFVSDGNNSLTLSSKEDVNLFPKLASDDAKSDTSKSGAPNFSFSFEIKPSLLSEKSSISVENSAASNTEKCNSSPLASNEKNSPTSNTKVDGNLFSRFDSGEVKPGINKSTTSNLYFGFGKNPTPSAEKSPSLYAVKPKTSSYVSSSKNLSTASNKEHENIFSKLPSTDTDKSVSPMPFSFGIKPDVSEKSAIALENLSTLNVTESKSSSIVTNEKNSLTSSAKEDGNLFSTLTSDGAKSVENKSTTHNSKFNFGIKPAHFSEKSAIGLENSASLNSVEAKISPLVSHGKNSLTLSTKEDRSLFSGFVSDGAKPDANKSTISNFKFSIEKNPTPLEEKSSALYTIEPKILLSFVTDAKTKEIFSRLPANNAKPDTDKSVSPNFNLNFGIKPDISEKSTIPLENSAASNVIEPKSSSLASNKMTSSTSSAKEDVNRFSTLASYGAKPDENKSTTPNFNFNFGTKPSLFSEKSTTSNSIESKSLFVVSNENNLSTSKTKEEGISFSTLASEGTKSAENKSTTPNYKFGIKPFPLFGSGNSATLKTLEPNGSSLISGVQNSPTSSTKKLGCPFSKLASDDAKTDLNKNTTQNLFSFGAPWSNSVSGPRRCRKAVRKLCKEKPSESSSTLFTFGSMDASEKSQEKTTGSTSTGFTFKFSNPNFQGKTSGTTSTGFTFPIFDPKYQGKTPGTTSTGFILPSFDPKSQGKTSGTTSTGFTFPSFDPKCQGPGTPLKFSPVTGADTMMKGGVPTTISTRHQYITSMKGYLNKSFEELRLEDYKWSEKVWNFTDSMLQKGGLTFANSSNAFENTDTSGNKFNFGDTEAAGVSELLKGLEELLHSGKHSDVTLTVQDKEFKAHRVILGIRSPVFSAMMEHETKEKATGVVNIPDCDPEPFSDFLHFLYTGSTKKIKADNILDLYTIADKYQVPELCKICVNYMKSCITLQNFCDILTLSLRHHERELTGVATQFFLKNSTEIAVTVNWSLFVKENPVAANELFLKALNLYKK